LFHRFAKRHNFAETKFLTTMSKNKQSYKITDEQFLEIYRENKGNCSLTAKAIEARYSITYTRQAVYLRALNHPDEMYHILSLFDDQCEERLINFADDEGNTVSLRTRIYIHIRNKLAKRLKIKKYTAESSDESQEPEVYVDIDGKPFSFADDADNSWFMKT
jgi:hypothetical protein